MQPYASAGNRNSQARTTQRTCSSSSRPSSSTRLPPPSDMVAMAGRVALACSQASALMTSLTEPSPLQSKIRICAAAGVLSAQAEASGGPVVGKRHACEIAGRVQPARPPPQDTSLHSSSAPHATLPCAPAAACSATPASCAIPAHPPTHPNPHSVTRPPTACSVTFLATPKVSPPTHAATWVPWPSQSSPTVPLESVV